MIETENQLPLFVLWIAYDARPITGAVTQVINIPTKKIATSPVTHFTPDGSKYIAKYVAKKENTMPNNKHIIAIAPIDKLMRPFILIAEKMICKTGATNNIINDSMIGFLINTDMSKR